MLKKTKTFLFFSSILLVIIIAILVVRQTKRFVPTTNSPEVTISTISALMKSSDTAAFQAKNNLLPKLPIVVSGFAASNGLKTDIVISSYSSDDPNTVRVEISGLDYQYNQNDPQTNPNMVAFRDSFQKVISLLTENGANIRQLHISLSNKQYIREISETWIKTLNLLP